MWACSPTNPALVSAYKGRKPRARIAQARESDFGGPLDPRTTLRLLRSTRLMLELVDTWSVYPGGPFFREEGPVIYSAT